jgi:NADPH:quinone reductase-like Zn-dependent oxidoreductase
MKAIRIHKFGKADVLRIDEVIEPICKSHQVKVKIKATGINHLDIWVRKGLPWITFPWVLGSDGTGIIIETGCEASKWKVGDEVVIHPGYSCGNCKFCNNQQENYCSNYGILGESCDGLQQEFCCLNENQLASKPSHLSFTEMASMPLVFMTSWQMLVDRAKLQKNEWVLIYGGTSGVGAAAIQIAKHLGANVIASVGDEAKKDIVKKMGADFVINHSDPDWLEKVKTINKGYDVIFEHVGQATWDKSMSLLSKGGRVVTCGATTGFKVEIDLRHLFFKQQSILGSTMSNFNNFYLIIDKINKGIFKPFIDSVYPFEQVSLAHQKIENRQHNGKVVLEFD